MGMAQLPIVWRAPVRKDVTRLVLIAYADHANKNNGDSTFVGQATIARELGKNRSSVNRATKELEALGFISIEPRFVYSPDRPPRRTSSIVTVHYDKILEAYEAYQATLRSRQDDDDDDDLTNLDDLLPNALSPEQHDVAEATTGSCREDNTVLSGGHTPVVEPSQRNWESNSEPNRELDGEVNGELSFTVNAAASTPAATPRTSTRAPETTRGSGGGGNDYDAHNREARAAVRAAVQATAADPDKSDELMDALVEHYSYEVADFCEHQFNDVPTMCENPYMAGKWLTTLLKTAADRRGIDVRPSKIIDAELAADNAWQDQLAHIDEATSNDNTELDKSA